MHPNKELELDKRNDLVLNSLIDFSFYILLIYLLTYFSTCNLDIEPLS